MSTTDPWQHAYDRAASVADRRQGEVLELADACVVLADAAWPMSQRAATEAESVGGVGLVAVPYPVDLVVLITQSCDLQATDRDAYLCQVAPVVPNVDEVFAKQVARGRRPGWVSLPWHDRLSVADLSRITTVERSLIVEPESRGKPRTALETIQFAEAVSRHLTRVALPDKVSRVLAPFLQRMRDRHDRRSPEGQCIARVGSLRLVASSGVDADLPDLKVLAVLEADDLPTLPQGTVTREAEIDALVTRGHEAAARAALESLDARARREAWQALAELWIAPAAQIAAAEGSGIGDMEVEVLNGEELSFARSRIAPELDLAYLTNRAA